MRIDWMIVMVCLPGRAIENAGVLILDHESKRLSAKLMPGRPEWDEDAVLVWNGFAEEVNEFANDSDGEQFMSWIEATLSHTIRVGDRQSLETDSVMECLDSLYVAHVRSNSRVARSSI